MCHNTYEMTMLMRLSKMMSLPQISTVAIEAPSASQRTVKIGKLERPVEKLYDQSLRLL